MAVSPNPVEFQGPSGLGQPAEEGGLRYGDKAREWTLGSPEDTRSHLSLPVPLLLASLRGVFAWSQ